VIRTSWVIVSLAFLRVASAQPAQPAPDGEAETGAEAAGEGEKRAAEPRLTDTRTEVLPAVAAEPASDLPPDAKFTFEPFGFLRLQYIFVQNDPNVAFVGRDDGFELQNVRPGVRGASRTRVPYAISVDGAVDERSQQNSPQGKLRVGLRDAYADAVISSKLFARVGYFATWVDPQRLISDTDRELIDRPLESRGMRSTEGWYTPGLTPGRSMGVALRSEPAGTGIGFEVAVQNGADEFSSNNDNDLPAVSAAVLFKLSNDGFIVAAGRFNPRTVGDLPFRQDETDFQGSVGAQLNTPVIRAGAGALVQTTTFGSTGGPSQNAYGAHAQLMVHLGSAPAWAGYRFAIIDPSSLIVTDRVMEHTVGAVLAVPDLRMRLQLQITHVMEQAERELSNSRAQLAVEVTL